VVAGMRAGFRACYQKLLSRDPLAAGNVRLTLLIDCHGTVTSILAQAYGVDQALVSCVLGRAAASYFSPPTGGWARIQVPITFVRQNATSTQ
jgi:hypothetical protein